MRLIIIFLTLLIGSCTNKRLIRDIEQLKSQRIILPTDLKPIWDGRDTIVTDFINVPVKMVIWYDSLICASCEVNRMYEWGQIISSADSLSQWFSIIYLFTPKNGDVDQVEVKLKADAFNYPIFIDHNAAFVKQNKLPKNRHLHSFLLDKENKVVIVGSPLHNPQLWELYKRTINKLISNDGLLPEK